MVFMSTLLRLVVVYTTALFLPTSLVSAADFSGPVVFVLDGDTIEVLHNGQAERIQLHGIDCPEKGQAYGKRAKQEVLGMEADARGSRCGGASSPSWSWRRTILAVP
jgi:endonuclease YncB( thermonuclease family)